MDNLPLFEMIWKDLNAELVADAEQLRAANSATVSRPRRWTIGLPWTLGCSRLRGAAAKLGGLGDVETGAVAAD
jgi:hypothetical protein